MTGRKIELKAKEMLENGYPFVEGPPHRLKWQRQDYFGLFDFLCCDFEGEVTGVQVSEKYLSQRDVEWREKWKAWPGRKVYFRWDEKKEAFV